MKMKTKAFREQGQALILVALAAIGLFAITALAIDGSARFSDRRHAQNAADTAAMAAALAKVNALTNNVSDLSPTTSAWATCPPPSGVLPSPVCEATLAAGLDRAGDNGYDDNLVSNNVEVHSPPVSGYYAGDSSYVQVIITSTVKTYFARVIGINHTQNLVQAVALIGKGGRLFDGASIISLNPNPNCAGGSGSGGGSVDVGGNGEIHLNGGGFFVNSSASCGYSQTSCSVTLVATGGAGINSAGSAINQSCAATLPPNTTEEPIVIPDDIFYPDEPIECSQPHAAAEMIGVDSNGVQNWRIWPGYYTDFPQGGLVPNNKNIILMPGVYCVDSDISWSGATFESLDGSSGVTIWVTYGHGISININSPIDLDPSSSGDYQNYLFVVEGDQSSIQSCTINGGSYLEIDGLIFAPYCNITINGDNSSESRFNAQLVGWNIKLNGGNVINFNYNPDKTVIIKRKVGLMK
jgi:Flp pilus assembly protein TadG